MPRYLAALVLLSATVSNATSSDVEFFESRIRPVLVEHCYACHNSSDTNEGELALDFRDGLRKGGSGGALIVAGDPANSRLIAILKHDVEGLEMPEDGPKLSDQIVSDFEKWIANGANDPRDEPLSADEITKLTSWEATLERRKQWWSFQPITKPTLPPGTGNPIDRFVAATLDDVGLKASEPAEPEILIRRLYFALIGLPPTPDEFQQWMDRYAKSPVVGLAKSSDRNVDSEEVLATSTTTEKLVDHLLESKQFGPRWARHWMDWIRYAESHGSEGDPAMKNAWMYRDYLIRALNDDIPYDQLVREHLAGDLLENPRTNRELELNESLLATIQLRMVFHGFSPTDALDEKVRFVDDQVNVISKAFLGLTVSCARCHDHKFDAISQADYYAMFGMFAACRPGRSIADTAERLNRNRDELAELKLKIGAAIANDWIDSASNIMDNIKEKIAGDVPEKSLLAMLKKWNDPETDASISEAWQAWVKESQSRKDNDSDVVRFWNLSESTDFGQWIQKGVKANANGAGQFAVALSGENGIRGVYPGGVYSHLISTNHPLRITSPDVKLDRKYDYWVRAIGGQDAATRYVTQDYPRTGTVFQASKLKGSWSWHKLNLDYWEGDTAHFELATGPDIPLQASDKSRSWFGASEVRMVKHGSPMPKSEIDFASAIIQATTETPISSGEVNQAVALAITTALKDWRMGECSDSQAHLIDHAIRIGLLENKLELLGEARPLIEQYRKLESEIQTPRRVPGLDDVPDRRQPLFIRGNHKQPADEIPRRFLEAIDSAPYPVTETGRRKFAEDILRDDNPLSRRVIVNRVWHHLFGKGIVSTPDNLGQLGKQPTHPELLDWLAVRFVQDGWSLKKLIRLIATSQTWQQSSEPSDQSTEFDPENLYLSHANVRRLEAEAIRDAMLQATGEISLEVQGGPVDVKSNRRSVFMRVKRNSLDPMLRAFDFPEPHTAVGRRDVTNVPAQSLLMMNSPLVAGYAGKLAQQLIDDLSDSNNRERIKKLYLRTLSRQPMDSEINAMLQHRSNGKLALKELLIERDGLLEASDLLQAEIDGIIEPKRQELAEQHESAPKSAIVQPRAHWEFDGGVHDPAGRLNVETKGGASIVGGRLVVKDGGYGTTQPLTKSIKAKTLEAWVQLDNLDQRGGGVVTVQTQNGAVFDSIVFAERQPRRWMAGSDGFRRTNDFSSGQDENEATDRLVHVAISYHSDGTVIGYRDGIRYGNPFKTSAPVEYRAGEAVVSFGVRHFPNAGNHRLAGSIERANLYDHALSDAEIAESFSSWSDQVSDRRVMQALGEADRARVERFKSEIEKRKRQIESLGSLPDRYGEGQVWTDLARTMFLLKEFIYVR